MLDRISNIGGTVRREIVAAPKNGAPLDLRGAIIEEALDLEGIEIGHVDFREATFKAAINLRGAWFRGLAWFDGATFEGKVDATNVRFDLDARFDAAHFASDAYFVAAEFRGVGCFDRAQLAGAAAFDRIVAFGNLSLEQTGFHGPASFRNGECLGGLWARGASFGSEVEMSGLEVHGRTTTMDASQRNKSGRITPFVRPSGLRINGLVWPEAQG